ncbi:hypothetical protein Tco_0426157 [Tanacetum coccineum]
MFVTRITLSFGLLTNAMVDALSVEPREHIFKKNYLIAIGVVMDLDGGTCCLPATRQVREDDEVGKTADEEAGGSADVYRNMSQGTFKNIRDNNRKEEKPICLEDKKIQRVGIFDEGIWAALGGNIRNLDSIWEEMNKITTLHEVSGFKSLDVGSPMCVRLEKRITIGLRGTSVLDEVCPSIPVTTQVWALIPIVTTPLTLIKSKAGDACGLSGYYGISKGVLQVVSEPLLSHSRWWGKLIEDDDVPKGGDCVHHLANPYIGCGLDYWTGLSVVHVKCSTGLGDLTRSLPEGHKAKRDACGQSGNSVV